MKEFSILVKDTSVEVLMVVLIAKSPALELLLKG